MENVLKITGDTLPLLYQIFENETLLDFTIQYMASPQRLPPSSSYHYNGIIEFGATYIDGSNQPANADKGKIT